MIPKAVKPLLFISLLAIAALLGFGIFYGVKRRNTTAARIARLPAFEFRTIAGPEFYSRNVKPEGKWIINYFNPDCEHCQEMAKEFVRKPDSFRQCNILMVTIADSSTTASFASSYDLLNRPNLTILLDDHYRFESLFGTSMVPSFFIYVNGHLSKKIIGETTATNLIN